MQPLLPAAAIFGIGAAPVAAADAAATAIVQVLPSVRIGTSIDAENHVRLVVTGDGAVSVRSGNRTIELRGESGLRSVYVGKLSDGDLLVEYP